MRHYFLHKMLRHGEYLPFLAFFLTFFFEKNFFALGVSCFCTPFEDYYYSVEYQTSTYFLREPEAFLYYKHFLAVDRPLNGPTGRLLEDMALFFEKYTKIALRAI